MQGSFRKRQLSANAQPIRITFDTSRVDPTVDATYGCQSTLDSYISPDGTGAVPCSQEQVMSSDKVNFVRNVMIPYAKNILESALKVVRLINMSLSTQSCGTTQYTPNPVPNSYRKPNAMQGVDLLVIVTTRPVRSDQNSTLAFASDCERDSKTNRPLLGFINMNPSRINPNDYQSLNSSLGTILHEITHILGFSSDFFNNQFVNPNNQSKRIPWNQTILTETVPSTGLNITKFIGKNVVEWARIHFNCPTINGVELEDQGGSGTAGSHWKRRVLQSEYMIGISPKFPVFSNFTLAFLEDTGFYITNRSMAQTLQYGLNYGCEFVKPGNVVGSGCDAWPSDIYRCRSTLTGTSVASTGCTFDRLAKATCRLFDATVDGPAPPAAYRYGSDKKSSTDKYSDYCPRFSDYTMDGQNSFCTFMENKPNIGVDRGENYGNEARCYISNLVSGVATGSGDPTPGCYKSFCASPTKLKILINSVYYPCKAGESIVAENFGGSLTCPSNDNLCSGSETIVDWPEFVSIDPAQGTAGTQITIKGTNFVDGMTVTVGGKTLDNLAFVDNTTYRGNINSNFDLTALAGKYVHVILKDSQGRTAVGMNAIQLELNAEDFFGSVGNWIEENPFITAGIFLAVIVVVGLGIFIYRRERRKARYGSSDAKSVKSTSTEVIQDPDVQQKVEEV